MSLQTIHVDTSVLLDQDSMRLVLNKSYVRNGQFSVVVSPFALAEAVSTNKGYVLPEGVDLFIFHEVDWNLFVDAVRRLWSEIKWLRLYDILIVATTLIDKNAKYLITRDRQILRSKTVKNEAKNAGIKVIEPENLP